MAQSQRGNQTKVKKKKAAKPKAARAKKTSGGRQKPSEDMRPLLLRAAMLGLGTLYACAFVNFAAIIATHNLTRAEPDRDYLCALGPTAAAALAASPRPLRCTIDAPRIEGWRDWGFRNWRVSLYLQPTLTGVRGE